MMLFEQKRNSAGKCQAQRKRKKRKRDVSKARNQQESTHAFREQRLFQGQNSQHRPARARSREKLAVLVCRTTAVDRTTWGTSTKGTFPDAKDTAVPLVTRGEETSPQGKAEVKVPKKEEEGNMKQ